MTRPTWFALLSAFIKAELVNYSMIFGIWFLFGLEWEKFKFNSRKSSLFFPPGNENMGNVQKNNGGFSVIWKSLTIILVAVMILTVLKSVSFHKCFTLFNKLFDFCSQVEFSIRNHFNWMMSQNQWINSVIAYLMLTSHIWIPLSQAIRKIDWRKNWQWISFFVSINLSRMFNCWQLHTVSIIELPVSLCK